MRELSIQETRDVPGGSPLVFGTLAGAAAGGYGAWHGGGNAGQVVSGALLGGVSGFYGGLGMFISSTVVGSMAAFAGGGGRWSTVPMVSK